jgi:hypothetical protein
MCWEHAIVLDLYELRWTYRIGRPTISEAEEPYATLAVDSGPATWRDSAWRMRARSPKKWA